MIIDLLVGALSLVCFWIHTLNRSVGYDVPPTNGLKFLAALAVLYLAPVWPAFKARRPKAGWPVLGMALLALSVLIYGVTFMVLPETVGLGSAYAVAAVAYSSAVRKFVASAGERRRLHAAVSFSVGVLAGLVLYFLSWFVTFFE